MTRHWDRDESPATLTHGAWQLDPRTRVLVWVADPEAPAKRDLSRLIACPTCRARTDQSCRSRRGNRVQDHASRLIPRQCKCGSALAPRKRYCGPCAKEADLASKRESYARVRDRRLATVTTLPLADDFEQERRAAS